MHSLTVTHLKVERERALDYKTSHVTTDKNKTVKECMYETNEIIKFQFFLKGNSFRMENATNCACGHSIKTDRFIIIFFYIVHLISLYVWNNSLAKIPTFLY